MPSRHSHSYGPGLSLSFFLPPSFFFSSFTLRSTPTSPSAATLLYMTGLLVEGSSIVLSLSLSLFSLSFSCSFCSYGARTCCGFRTASYGASCNCYVECRRVVSVSSQQVGTKFDLLLIFSSSPLMIVDRGP